MAKQQKGILGEKLGMTQVWDDQNRLVPVTVVKAGPCVVTQVRTPDKDGYDAVQIAFGAIDPRKVNKPVTGHFSKAGVPPRRHIAEIRTSDASTYTIGQEITADVFAAEGDSPVKVDVVATSKGHGFSGVMKRHGFSGLGAGHGGERKHRSPGAGSRPPASSGETNHALSSHTSRSEGMSPRTSAQPASAASSGVRPNGSGGGGGGKPEGGGGGRA